MGGFELKIPKGKNYKPKKSQADIVQDKKKVLKPVLVEDVVEKPKKTVGKKSNFTLLVTEDEYSILVSEAKRDGRGVAPFVLRTLKTKGLFSDTDVFLGNTVSSKKTKSISIKLTDAEHRAIEKIGDEEGRTKNQVVSMFLHQQLFKNELS